MTEPLRALLVDDEPLAREGLRMMLSELPDVEVVGEAATGEEAVDLLRRLRPDLLFLDIGLPDLDGFAVLEREPPGEETAVVFVTAFDEHAVRAFEVQAVDYLVKPFGDSRLEAAVERVRERKREGRLRGLHDALSVARGAGSERVILTSGGALVVFEPGEIDWIQAEGDYVRVHAGDRSPLADGGMSELETRLAPHGFFRIHRSILVNLSRVRDVRPAGGSDREVRLADGTRLRVARRRYEGLLEALSSGR